MPATAAAVINRSSSKCHRYLLGRLFPLRLLAAALLFSAITGCASRAPIATPDDIVRRTGVPPRPADAEGTVLPPGVNIADGLTQDEAVAIALWNNPDFQVQRANLGFARALAVREDPPARRRSPGGSAVREREWRRWRMRHATSPPMIAAR